MRVLSSSLYKYTTFSAEIQIAFTFRNILRNVKMQRFAADGVCQVLYYEGRSPFGSVCGEAAVIIWESALAVDSLDDSGQSEGGVEFDDGTDGQGKFPFVVGAGLHLIFAHEHHAACHEQEERAKLLLAKESAHGKVVNGQGCGHLHHSEEECACRVDSWGIAHQRGEYGEGCTYEQKQAA